MFFFGVTYFQQRCLESPKSLAKLFGLNVGPPIKPHPHEKGNLKSNQKPDSNPLSANYSELEPKKAI